MNSYLPHNTSIITGGLGFIGSNLAIRLISNGTPCTLIDSLNPNYGGNFFNISPIADSPLLTVNISDIRDHYSLTPLFSNTKSLFNLAGQTSHMDSMSEPLVDLDINAKAQLALLEVCKTSSPDINITFASTRQLYGVPQYLPVDELHLLFLLMLMESINLQAKCIIFFIPAFTTYHLLYYVLQIHTVLVCVLKTPDKHFSEYGLRVF